MEVFIILIAILLLSRKNMNAKNTYITSKTGSLILIKILLEDGVAVSPSLFHSDVSILHDPAFFNKV